MNGAWRWVGALFLVFALGCDAEETAEDGAEGTETAAVEDENVAGRSGQECSVAEDCAEEQVNISIWYATCDGDLLLEPEGTGDMLCVNGYCSVDFAAIPYDCTEDGKVCGPNPDESVQGDICLDPAG